MCSQVLPHVCVEDDSLPRSEDGVCLLTKEIETAVKKTGDRACDLLSQQRLNDAIAELKVS